MENQENIFKLREELHQYMQRKQYSDEDVQKVLRKFDEKFQTPTIRKPPPALDQAIAGAKEGVYGVLGMPGDIAGGLSYLATGKPVKNPPFGSRSLGAFEELIFGTNPYKVSESTGIPGTMRDVARSATEGVIGAGTIGGIAKTTGTLIPETSLVREGVTGAFGGIARAIARESGYEEPGQFIAELLGSVAGPGLAIGTKKTLSGIGKIIGMPEDPRVSMGKALQRATDTELSSRWTGEDLPPSLRTRLENTFPDEDFSDFPTLVANPHLKPFVGELRKHPDVWNEILRGQSQLSNKTINKLYELMPESSMTSEDIGKLVEHSHIAKLGQFDLRVNDAMQNLEKTTALGKSSAAYSEEIVDKVIDGYLATKQAAQEGLEHLKPQYGDIQADVRPIISTLKRLKTESVTAKEKWVPGDISGRLKRIIKKGNPELFEEPKAEKFTGTPDAIELVPPKEKFVEPDLEDLSEDMPILVPVKEVIDMRSDLLERERGLAKTEKARLRRNIVQITEAIDDDEVGVFARTIDIDPSAEMFVNDWRKGNEVYRAYKELYTQKVTNKILFQERTGITKIPNTDVLKAYFKDKNTITEYKSIFGDSDDALIAANAHFVEGMIGTKTELPTAAGMGNYLNKNKVLLEEFPEVQKNLTDIITAKKLLETESTNLLNYKKEFESLVSTQFLGQRPDLYVDSLLSIQNPGQRFSELNFALNSVKRAQVVKDAIGREYYKNLFSIDETLDPINQVLKINTNSIREKLTKYDREFRTLYGLNWNKTQRGVKTILDQIDWLKKAIVTPEMGPIQYGDEEFRNIAKLLLGSVAVGRGVARSMISVPYAIADRALTVGTTHWSGYTRQKATDILKTAMTNPEAADMLRLNVNPSNMKKLEAFYHTNIYVSDKQPQEEVEYDAENPFPMMDRLFQGRTLK